MKAIKILVCMSTLVGIFISCRKYPDDPFLSLHTVKSRMINDWRIQAILLNGDDVTQLYNDSLIDYDFTSSRFSINRDPDERKVLEVYFFIEGSKYFETGIDLQNNKRSVKFYKFATGGAAGGYPDTSNLKIFNRVFGKKIFKILKLYKNDFIITNTTNSNTYEIRFKK